MTTGYDRPVTGLRLFTIWAEKMGEGSQPVQTGGISILAGTAEPNLKSLKAQKVSGGIMSRWRDDSDRGSPQMNDDTTQEMGDHQMGRREETTRRYPRGVQIS